MRYLSGAPGHLRHTPQSSPSHEAGAGDDPTAEECDIIDRAAREQNATDRIVDEVEDWYTREESDVEETDDETEVEGEELDEEMEEVGEEPDSDD